MSLLCDGLYRITCKRVKESEAIGQAGPFSLISAMQEGYFTDVIIKSSDGLYVSRLVIYSSDQRNLTRGSSLPVRSALGDPAPERFRLQHELQK